MNLRGCKRRSAIGPVRNGPMHSLNKGSATVGPGNTLGHEGILRAESVRHHHESACRIVVAVFALSTAVVACGDGTGPTTIDRIETITVSLEDTEIAAGRSTQATAMLWDADGHARNEPVVWASADPRVATVNDAGTVTGLMPGVTDIIASNGDVSGSARVTIVAAATMGLVVSAQPATALNAQPLARSFEIAVIDEIGSVDTDRATVTVSIVRGSGSLAGTLEQSTVDGIASFDDLVLTGRGPQTLEFTSAGRNPATSVPIEIVQPGTPRLSWNVLRPRVIRAGRSEPVGLTLVVDHAVTRVELVPATGDPAIPLEALAPNVYSLMIDGRYVFNPNSYRTGDDHVFIGFLDMYEGTTLTRRGNLFADVRTPAVPDISITTLGPNAQISDHILNLRRDDLLNGAGPTPDLTHEIFRWLPDDFDFIAVVEQVETFSNRFFRGVRNNTPGLGLPSFDDGADWGSPARLKGLIAFPFSPLFDASFTAVSHEIGHNWLAFVSGFNAGGHWKPSTMAYGVIGYSGSGGEGSTFPYLLEDFGASGIRMNCVDRTRSFNPAELYFMGLLPRDSVTGTFIVLEDPVTPSCGAIYTGAVRRVTIDSLIAAAGSERPLDTVREHHVAVVVVSTGSLLTVDEMAFFDFMAARGASTMAQTFTEGFDRGETLPFYLATGGRARLDMAVR